MLSRTDVVPCRDERLEQLVAKILILGQQRDRLPECVDSFLRPSLLTQLAGDLLQVADGASLVLQLEPGTGAVEACRVVLWIERRETIAVAESSTGGLISAALVAVPAFR